VTLATTNNAIVLHGQGGKLFTGRANDHAAAVALRLAGSGTGYWVFPLAGPDPQYPGELTWSATCDFAPSAAPGPRSFLFAAIDGEGRAGATFTLPMCIAGPVPDNLHLCDPTRPPPDVVLRLSWDSDVDLDLVVVAPDGREISAKASRGEGDARVDRDSLAACAKDGLRVEHVVFPARPSGRFNVFASLFDACGLPAVRFTLDVLEAQGEGAARQLVRRETRSGRMIDLDANGGRDRGLFIIDPTF
jgi:hypothetical protein